MHDYLQGIWILLKIWDFGDYGWKGGGLIGLREREGLGKEGWWESEERLCSVLIFLKIGGLVCDGMEFVGYGADRTYLLY